MISRSALSENHECLAYTAGGTAILAMALRQSMRVAYWAYAVLHDMLACGQLPADQVGKVKEGLAGMQGVRNLSALLCPPLKPKQKASRDRPFVDWGEPYTHTTLSMSAVCSHVTAC